MTLKDKAIEAFKTVVESLEPKRERIIGQLGDAAGVVEVPNRPNFNYVRLSGADTRTVRAYNLAVMPELGRYVWVEISRVEGEPKYYRVVGYSEYESEGSPADPPVYPGGQSAAEKVVVWTAGTTPNPQKALSRALTEVAQLAGDFNTGSCYVASGLPKFNNIKDAGFIMNPDKIVDKIISQ